MNTIEVAIRLQDQLSAQLAQAGENVKAFGDKASASVAGAASGFRTWAKEADDGAVKVGAAMLAPGPHVDAFKKGLENLREVGSAGAAMLSNDYTQLGTVLGALPGIAGVAASAIGSFVGGAITDTIRMVDHYDKLSKKTGETVEFLSQFTEAADDVRVSSEAVSANLTIFARKLGGVEDAMDGAATSTEGMAGRLADLNIAVEDTDGKARPMSEILLDVSDVFQKMPDGAQKSAMAMELFGRRGAEMIPILNTGREAIKGSMEAAKALGTTLDGLTRDQTVQLMEANDALADSFKGVKNSIAKDLIPELATLTKWLSAPSEEFGVFGSAMRALAGDQSRIVSGMYSARIALLEDAAKKREAAKATNEYGDAAEGATPKVEGMTAAQAEATRRLAELTVATGNSGTTWIEYQDHVEEAQRGVAVASQMAKDAQARDLAEVRAELDKSKKKYEEYLGVVRGAATAPTGGMNANERYGVVASVATSANPAAAGAQQAQALAERAIATALKDKVINEQQALDLSFKYAQGQKSLSDVLTGLDGVYKGTIRTVQQSAEEQDKEKAVVINTRKALEDKQQAYDKLQKSGKATQAELAAAALAVKQEGAALEAANKAAGENSVVVGGATQDWKDLGDAVKIITAALGPAGSALLGIKVPAGEAGAVMDRTADAIDRARANAGPAGSAAANLGGQLKEQNPVWQNSAQLLNAIADAEGRLKDKHVTINIDTYQNRFDKMNEPPPPPPRASGGPVDAGRTYIVGERGPELFTAPGNGQIINAADTANLRRSSGARQLVQVVNITQIQDARRVVTAMARSAQRESLRQAVGV